MRCPLSRYRGKDGAAAVVHIGQEPGEPPYAYRAAAGGTVEGPTSYRNIFEAAGFEHVQELGEGAVTAPREWPGKAPEPAPVGEHAGPTAGFMRPVIEAREKALGSPITGPPAGPFVPPTTKEEADEIERRGGSPSSLTWPPKAPPEEKKAGKGKAGG